MPLSVSREEHFTSHLQKWNAYHFFCFRKIKSEPFVHCLNSTSDTASYKWHFYFTSALSFLLFPNTRKWPLNGVLPLHKMHLQLNLQRRLLHIACRNTISIQLQIKTVPINTIIGLITIQSELDIFKNLGTEGLIQ